MGRLGSTLVHAWNVFRDRSDQDGLSKYSQGVSSSHRQDRVNYRPGNERIIIASIYNRIAVDCSMVDLRHVRLDDDERYLETIYSGLQYCLSTSANIDQDGRALIQDAVYTMCEHGDMTFVPIETDLNPNVTGGYDIRDLRVGRVADYLPRDVRVEVYNDRIGTRQQVVLPKETVAIVENPFYSVMNEPNSILQRLLRKLAELDEIETQAAAGKMDIIIQFPHTVRSDQKRDAAEQRRKDIEFQLSGSKYGVAWADATEKITQLNRPVENNMMKTIEHLWGVLYAQMGITREIMDGTADEATMLNYYNRTIAPILRAMANELKRKFLTKTAITQKQSIEFYRDPFMFVTMKDLAEIGDKFTRNEIASANDIRQVVGWKPSKDPKANELRNSNMPREDTETGADPGASDEGLAAIERAVNEAFAEIGEEVPE